ncbi:hypothetical protein BN946_scf184985.g81 [Trametes cinnabarina]|uniref:Uncharacterized protein n=1 Tax=Pycnoporus cinnabarinus TaxID=5643 RepID=A0A060SDT2_PYCCI|nr:hypothetical protein BN946_scf184985.g81 [Trametes cinnabarina]
MTTLGARKADKALRVELIFPSPFRFNSREPITLVELRMHWLLGMVRSKPQWWEKVNDPAIVAKWRREIVDEDAKPVEKLWGGEERFNYGRGEKQWPRDPITDAQLDYVLDELKYEASRRDSQTGIYATAIPKVYESRSLILRDVKAALISGVSALESTPEEERDWHPGSNQQVLDLLHPSLYCLRIGQSYIHARNSSSGDPLRVQTEEEYLDNRPDLNFFLNYQPFAVSSKYQWLPTDFAVSAEGEVKPLGYINNIHPIHHHELDLHIPSILSRFTPLFEHVLSEVLSPEPPIAVNVNPYLWYQHLEEPDSNEDGSCTEKWIEFPLRGRTLQVIVKLANIVLTPEKPRYPGGSWHVEGMANEEIVATGLYYYASSNITESRLAFRTVVGHPNVSDMKHQHGDVQGFYTAYGFARYDGMNQALGHLIAEEDKCIAFPNVYQHRVDGFELTDPSKPGHRKTLCFSLVDPTARIHSTSDVPPKQEDWMTDEVMNLPALQKLPVELSSMVMNMAKLGTIGRKQAERIREELMGERGKFRAKHSQAVFELEFRMCEH